MTTRTASSCLLIISRHACERFQQRHERLFRERLKDPERTIRKILLQSVFEPIAPKERVRRLISNGFKDCWYTAACGWRFVCIAKDGNVLIVTIERRNPWEN